MNKSQSIVSIAVVPERNRLDHLLPLGLTWCDPEEAKEDANAVLTIGPDVCAEL